MARNEEKQQGRLNRLWLQKEREEGRLRDVRHERRPKLASLHSASSVKKWIPSIKNEIEYYLQQSQLCHYPERKIAEFKLHIQVLEKEYKSFCTKLRVLDPSCKHKPWTPRAYCRRRADPQDSSNMVKSPRLHEDISQWSRGESDLASNWTGCHKTSLTDKQEPFNHPKTRFQSLASNSQISETSNAISGDQDQPLSFDRTRLAVAAAAFRGLLVQPGFSQTHTLARVLQSGLPNLSYCPLGQTISLGSRSTENDNGTSSIDGQEHKSACEGAEGLPEKSSNSNTTEEQTAHILGLDYYSSSDEDCDA